MQTSFFVPISIISFSFLFFEKTILYIYFLIVFEFARWFGRSVLADQYLKSLFNLVERGYDYLSRRHTTIYSLTSK